VISANGSGTEGTDGPRLIRAQRRAAGLSQQRLAELAECSVAMVRVLEGGYKPAESRVLGRIADVFNEKRPAAKPGASTSSTGRHARHGEA
jgi:transcriptional regulator with XRE-family HTH domain